MLVSTTPPALQPEYAGFGVRAAAYLIDAALLSLLGASFPLLLLPSDGSNPADRAGETGGLLAVLYFAFCWSRLGGGRTLGMRVMGLRVIRTDGGLLGMGGAFVRVIGLWFSFALCFLGVINVAMDGRKQGWHDKLAGSLVVHAGSSSDEGQKPLKAGDRFLATIRRPGGVVGIIIALLVLTQIALGVHTSGVRIDNLGGPPGPPVAGRPPGCVLVHEYGSRSWGPLVTISHDVIVRGCNNRTGELRLDGSPTCQVSSFLGAGSATCAVTPEGKRLRVNVVLDYPAWLNAASGERTRYSFSIDPGGGYSSR
jgi:uncharacterized RDD family membrane protein YckC